MKIEYASLVVFSVSILPWVLSDHPNPTQGYTSRPHVGIIGAGAAGLTTAFLLQEKGYRVTVLEKSKQVGGLASTFQIRGKAYDLSTMFIPGASISGAGIERTLQRMIDASGATLSPVSGSYTLNTTDKFLDVIPEPLQKYSTKDIIEQLERGLYYSWQLFVCAAVDSSTCATCGSLCASAKVPLQQWGEQFQVPAYADLVLYVFDGLGAGPTAFGGATFQDTLSSFAVVDVVDVLRNLGVKPSNLSNDAPMHPRLDQMLSSVRWYMFEKGFQRFWQRLARKMRMNVTILTSKTVQSISLEECSHSWKVTTTRTKHKQDDDYSYKSHYKTYTFDNLIVTAAPQDAVQFLPEEASDQKALLAKAIPRVPPNDIFLVWAKDADACDTDVDNAIVSFWTTGFGQGTMNLVDSSTCPESSKCMVKPIFWFRRHPQWNVFVVGTMTLDPSITAAASYREVKNYARNQLGLKIQRLIQHERYLFPSGPLPVDGEAWEEGWLELQGKDGLWFNGEAFTGGGVPGITRYTNQFVSYAFPALS